MDSKTKLLRLVTNIAKKLKEPNAPTRLTSWSAKLLSYLTGLRDNKI